MDITIGELLERLRDQRGSKKAIEYQLKEVDAEIRATEMQIMERMDDIGITQSKSAIGSVTIGESIVPQTDNWEEFINYVREHDAFYLFQKRVAVLPYREIITSGKSVPGLLPFTKRKLTFKES